MHLKYFASAYINLVARVKNTWTSMNKMSVRLAKMIQYFHYQPLAVHDGRAKC